MKNNVGFVFLLSGVCIVNAMEDNLEQTRKKREVPGYSYGAPVPPNDEQYAAYLKIKEEVCARDNNQHRQDPSKPRERHFP